MNEENKTYSIQLRLRRITYEDAYVSVPVTDLITKQNEDGSIGIDFDKLSKAGIEISVDSRVEWQIENATIDLHETQRTRPVGRRSFDPSIAD